MNLSLRTFSKLLLTMILCTNVAVSSSSYQVVSNRDHHIMTSMNSSKLVFRIPKNYKVNIPLFSIRLLRPSRFSHSDDYERSYQEINAQCLSRVKRSTTKKVPDDLDQQERRSIGKSIHRNKWNADSEILPNNKFIRRHRDEIRIRDKKTLKVEFRRSIRAEKNSNFIKLISRKKDLFQLHFNRETAVVSVSLKRSLDQKDYTGLRQSLVEFEILERLPRKDENCVDRRRNNQEEFQVLFQVVLHINEPFNCNRLTEKMCLLPEDHMILQQWENEPAGLLFALPSLASLCQDIVRTIDIVMTDLPKNTSPELTIDPGKNTIHTTRQLDREFRDSWLNFTLTCQLRNKKTSKTSKKMKMRQAHGYLYVLDVDDSPPIRLRNPIVTWGINDDHDLLDDRLMIIDPDINNDRNYSVEVISDNYGIVEVDTISQFIIDKEYCAKFTSTSASPLTAQCTILTTHLNFDDEGQSKYPSEVNFSLVFRDNSLTNKSHKTSATVIYNMTLIMNNSSRFSKTDQPNIVNILTCDDDLPTEVNVTIYKPLQIHSRLHQMLNSSYEMNYKKLNIAPRMFSLSRESLSVGLDITPVLGILYISDPKSLQDFVASKDRFEVIVKRVNNIFIKDNLEVIVNSGNNFTSSIFIELAQDSVTCDQPNPKPSYITVASPMSCAIHEDDKSCKKSCGVGSLSGGCSWRNFDGLYRSSHYATCSPDLSTCPDGFCDELESQHKDICPQDCVEQHMTKGSDIVLNKNYDPPRGIYSGFGVCSCNDFCTCFPAEKGSTFSNWLPGGRDKRPKNGNFDQPVRRYEDSSCQDACQVSVSIGIVLVLFVSVVVFCRRRRDCGGKFKDGDMNRSHYPSDFIDDHSSSYASGAAHGEAHAVAIHAVHNLHANSSRQTQFMNNNQHFSTDLHLIEVLVDEKWEFPRSQLIIEQTLGEGEFGKVMKGKATDLGGKLGTSVVAVKMLKNNSTSAELSDLMSEYQLLKEVNHPNVIRLLGACTTKSGPIYLLIEYCKYGSLRSYLQKSLHFELESRVGSTPVEESSVDYQLTPKHLLSFAWQVCKGMTYLGNMKLVHRDLAARNVLLAEGKICKISDFGLTRDVYEGELYFKRSKGRVPVKWMAIESLAEQIYTSKSDIWGFGVLLWELITLGSSPYPGVTPERLYTLLHSGFRMEKPSNCSDALYQVMKSCWLPDPVSRPSFSELVSIFERMIEVDVEYLELRSLTVTNRTYFDNTMLANDVVSPASKISSRSIDKESEPRLHQPNIDETKLDKDCYLLARSSLSLEPPGGQGPQKMMSTSMTFNDTRIHAHNPSYSPAKDDFNLKSITTPLKYSSLENGPDEEEDVGIEEGQDGCHSEGGDSDSGRATGDSGYLTEEGRKSKEPRMNCSSSQSFGKTLGSYSPLTEPDLEDDHDTSAEDFEERQELLTVDIVDSTEKIFPHESKACFRKGKRKLPSASNLSSAPSSGQTQKFLNPQNTKRSPVQV